MRTLVVGMLLLVCSTRAAGQAGEPYIPPALGEWRDWVLHEEQWRECPMLFDGPASSREARFCAWPGVLELAVNDSGAAFRQAWTVAGDVWRIPLPGGRGTPWPEQVSVNGQAARFLSRGDRPYIELPAGDYTITGEFRWSQRPGELAIAARTGLIELSVDGQAVLVPQIDDNRLFLGVRQSTQETRDEIRASVYRLAIDSAPSRLITLLRINVSGSLREATFGPLLPPDFVPERLDSELPARFDADGRLRVQVRPGEWILRLHARASEVLDRVAPVVGGGNLPDVEILSFQAQAALRVAVPSGLEPVDPVQTNVPPEWRSYPAFRLGADDALTLDERSRGIVDSQNQLGIRRSLWLDFDGGGMTAVDAIAGSMRRDWRLEMAAPYRLESAEVNGESVPVTAAVNGDERGVELRQEQLALRAVSRIEASRRIPVTGWRSSFNGATVQLHLPPGRRLLAAPGADVAAGAWLGRWELLDIFLLLVVTAAAARLFGPLPGAIAFAALSLSFHESGAPAWLWLNLLATVALLRVAAGGRLGSWLRAYFYLGLVALGLALLPFVSDQVRFAMYPQLERSHRVVTAEQGAPAPVPVDPELSVEAAASAVRMASPAAELALDEVIVSGARIQAQSPPPLRFERYAPKALVQAGPGVPAWQWQRYRLVWDGPVEAGQMFRLVIAPPWLTAIWRMLTAVLTVFFAAFFLIEAFRRLRSLPGGPRLGTAATGIVLALAISQGLPGEAQADEMPDPQLLEELRQRLTAAPLCAPRCADFPAARVTIEPRALDIELEVHASVPVAVPVPGARGDWRPRRITLDGQPVSGVSRAAGRLIIAVPAGRHLVTLSGALPEKSSIEVPFPETPRLLDAQARGWSVNGLIERRLVTGSLQFERIRDSDPGDERPRSWESSRFPVFVTLVRRLELGLDWRVVTTAQRVAPATGALEVVIPLIDGESVITEDNDTLEIAEGVARISMPSSTSTVSWVSSLAPLREMRLAASDGSRWVETWEIAAGSIWHIEVEGVPESVDGRQVPGARVARYHPRGGETLTIAASRPAAVTGATTAIESVHLESTIGRRLVESTLQLGYRATRGDQQQITLPAHAEITTILIDGQTEPLRPVDSVLTLPIRPGRHRVSVGFRELRDQALVARAPVIGLGAAASNVSVTLHVADDRWLLLTRGPMLGPAVLYWPQLLVLAVLAGVLGRIPWTPLKTRHWLLLALGFSTFSWPVLGIVVAWVLLTGARERWPVDLQRRAYNAVQVLHALLTMLALATIVVSLPTGLLGAPDMTVVGNASSSTALRWFTDQTTGNTPGALFLSLPLWAYKALILLWALWLTFALLAWLPWVWRLWSKAGLWRPAEKDSPPLSP